MINTENTEDNLNEYVERYSEFGINITSHKTKLAKKIYLILLLIKSELLLTIILFSYIPNFKNNIIEFSNQYMFVLILALIVSFLLILILPETNSFNIIIMIPFKAIFLVILNIFITLLII